MMKQQAIIRLIVLLFLLTNQTLIVMGLNPLPFSEEFIFDLASSLVTFAFGLWVYWKNNNLTKEAQSSQRYLNELKGK